MRRTASEVIRELEMRIARLESNINKNASHLKRMPKVLREVIKAYVLSGGTGSTAREWYKERPSQEFLDLLSREAKMFDTSTVGKIMEYALPTRITMKGLTDEAMREVENFVREAKQKASMGRAPRGSKVELMLLDKRGWGMEPKMVHPRATIYYIVGGESLRETTVQEALETQQNEIARSGNPITEFFDDLKNPAYANAMSRGRYRDSKFARLERQAAWPTIDDSLFSVDGDKPAKGKDIVRNYRNKFKTVALEMALEEAFFEEVHRGDRNSPAIKLVKKQ